MSTDKATDVPAVEIEAPRQPSTVTARQIAGAILEVLAGVRSITDAAVALGISSARYYQWEARAVAGLLAACEPRGPGALPGAALPAELEQLRAERDRLKAEAARYQALARIAQSAFGPAQNAPAEPIPAPARRNAAKPNETAARQRKKRTPSVRALRLAERVREAPAAPLTTPAPGSSIAPPGGG